MTRYGVSVFHDCSIDGGNVENWKQKGVGVLDPVHVFASAVSDHCCPTWCYSCSRGRSSSVDFPILHVYAVTRKRTFGVNRKVTVIAVELVLLQVTRNVNSESPGGVESGRTQCTKKFLLPAGRMPSLHVMPQPRCRNCLVLTLSKFADVLANVVMTTKRNRVLLEFPF